MKIDMRVDGNTKIIGIIANPVSHTKSPYLHNSLSKELKDNFIYVPFLVKDNDVKKAIEGIRALNVTGINVTVPYKEIVMEYLNSVSEEAKLIGAVNTIKNENGKLIGYNTDGLGFYKDLVENTKESLKDKVVSVIGAGGSARSISAISVIKGARKIYIINRTIEKAEKIINNLNEFSSREIAYALENNYDNIQKCIEKSDVIINTTSLGMKPNINALPVPKNIRFRKNQIVYDIIYTPFKTEFIKLADNFGCKTINGIGMLYYQGIEAYKIWSDREFLNDNILDSIFMEFKKL